MSCVRGASILLLALCCNYSVIIYNPVCVGVPRAPDYQCGGGQPASQHPVLVQERTQAMSQSHAHRGALPLPG